MPITPATTGPELMPILSSRPGSPASIDAATTSRISSARARPCARGPDTARHAGSRHVAVADRLDLLQTVPLHNRVEPGEELVEHADHLGRRETLGERREPHDVGEQDGRRREVVGDRLGRRPSIARRSGVGRMLMRSASAFSCSTRSSASAALRWWAKEARRVKATEAVSDHVQRQHRAGEPHRHDRRPRTTPHRRCPSARRPRRTQRTSGPPDEPEGRRELRAER